MNNTLDIAKLFFFFILLLQETNYPAFLDRIKVKVKVWILDIALLT